jgi:hypothetical protein
VLGQIQPPLALLPRGRGGRSRRRPRSQRVRRQEGEDAVSRGSARSAPQATLSSREGLAQERGAPTFVTARELLERHVERVARVDLVRLPRTLRPSGPSEKRTRRTESGIREVRSQRRWSGPWAAFGPAGGGSGCCLCPPRPVAGRPAASGAGVVARLRRGDGGGGMLGPRIRAECGRSTARVRRPGERLYPASVSRLCCGARTALFLKGARALPERWRQADAPHGVPLGGARAPGHPHSAVRVVTTLGDGGPPRGARSGSRSRLCRELPPAAGPSQHLLGPSSTSSSTASSSA